MSNTNIYPTVLNSINQGNKRRNNPIITYHYVNVTPHELQLLVNQHSYDSIEVTVESYHIEGYPLYHVTFIESNHNMEN